MQDIGRPSDVLTGALSGNGRIAIADWQRWDRLVDWDASLSLVLRDGVVQRLPALVRLWSALSLQGLLSFELPSLGSGLAFSSLGGDLTIDQGRLRTDNLVLDSSAVRFDTSGSLDLTPLTLDLTTALVPLHGITSSVAKVPLAGELLARGADRLTTLSFRVTGPLANPTVAPSLAQVEGGLTSGSGQGAEVGNAARRHIGRARRARYRPVLLPLTRPALHGDQDGTNRNFAE